MKTICLYIAVFSLVFSSTSCAEQPGALNNSTVFYDPETLLIKILNGIQSRAKFKFEGANDQYVHVDAPTDNYKVSDNVRYSDEDIGQKITFIDDNRVGRVEKKRRRRKPRVQGLQGATGYYGPYAPPQAAAVGVPPFYGHHPVPIYRPPKRQTPSLASEALSSVTEALTSIALFDDRECVARLLCEAASGAPGSGTLQSISGLQPLLTLLSAYRGISSNPLFVFGRAAFLGMSSRTNPASCRYAYPRCPTDPEQLVHYLNNHNGGFFRFFNAPQHGQSNINQFYHQLSQNYNHQGNQFTQNGDYNLPYQPNQVDGFPIQNYGSQYPYDQVQYDSLNKIRLKNNFLETNKLEKRIQNRPGKYTDDAGENLPSAHIDQTKWSFPDDIKTDNIRIGKGLKFPENTYLETNKEVNKRDPRGFKFPETRDVEYGVTKYQDLELNYNYNNLESDVYDDHGNHEYDSDPSVRTIYVVRGNGDPKHPEIIKLRPGQAVY